MIHDNDIYDFKYTLKKEELEEIMKPYIKRTINHCNTALKKANLTPDKIDYIILVGGSTLSPVIRESLESTFDIPLKYDIDPTTVVAKGAAQFAGTIPDPIYVPYEDSFGLKLDYESKGPLNEEFYVSGEVLSDKVDDFEGFTIEAINIKTKRSTGKVPVESDGYFEFELIPEDEINKYSINLYDASGSLVELDKNSANAIEYKAGTPPVIILPHTLGLGLRDDSLFILAKEGSPLPYHNMEPFKTTVEVTKGEKTSVLRIPLYNGTATKASNNEQVGTLRINGTEVDRTIRKGSEITVTVDIDESRVMKFDVRDLDTGQKFDFEIFDGYVIPAQDMIIDKFNLAKGRYEDLKEKCRGEIVPDEIEEYLTQIEEENIIGNITAFIEKSENDEDELVQAEKLIKQLNEILNHIDEYFEEQEQFENVKEFRDDLRKIVNEKGTLEDKDVFNDLSNQLDDAIQNNDRTKAKQIQELFGALRYKINRFDDLKGMFLWLTLMGKYDPSDAEIVSDLKERGSMAISNEDEDTLENVVGNLMQLVTNLPSQSQNPTPTEDDDDDSNSDITTS
jgi:molecular chaperone DnaK